MDVYRLDEKDKKILYELDMDARQPVSSIAKKIGTSKEVAAYRIKRLEEERVILGYYTVIDLYSAGLSATRYFIRLRNVDQGIITKMSDYCVNNPFIGWVVLSDGFRDFSAVIYSKRLGGTFDIWCDILKRFGSYIDNVRVAVLTKLMQYPSNYLYSTRHPGMISLEEREEKIDEIDDKILKCLSQDARCPLSDIASKVNQCPEAVRHRIQSLEKRKVIVCYRPFLNIQRLGYMFYKNYLYFNNFEDKDYMSILAYARNDPRVTLISQNVSDFAVEIGMAVKNPKECYNFMHELRTRFPVIKNHESVYVHEFKKVNYYIGN